jgi:hypothetical protein
MVEQRPRYEAVVVGTLAPLTTQSADETAQR